LSSGPTAWLPQGDAVGGAYAGSPLVPVSQYTYPVGVTPRASTVDAGAVESGSGVTGPPPPAPAPVNPVWSVVSGALPPGVTISSGGLISGTPTEAGTFTFTVQVVMPSGATGSRRYSFVVASAEAVVILPEILPDGKAGTTYSSQLTAK
jgi:large repetitive protein